MLSIPLSPLPITASFVMQILWHNQLIEQHLLRGQKRAAANTAVLLHNHLRIKPTNGEGRKKRGLFLGLFVAFVAVVAITALVLSAVNRADLNDTDEALKELIHSSAAVDQDIQATLGILQEEVKLLRQRQLRHQVCHQSIPKLLVWGKKSHRQT